MLEDAGSLSCEMAEDSILLFDAASGDMRKSLADAPAACKCTRTLAGAVIKHCGTIALCAYFLNMSIAWLVMPIKSMRSQVARWYFK